MRRLRLNKTSTFVVTAFLVAPFFANAQTAGKAALFLSPQAGSFLVGGTFDVSIILDTKGAAVNTVEIELLFPPDKLQITSPSVGKSIIQVWPAPPSFSNREGKIYFVGGIPSPGIVVSDGIVLTLSFRVVSPGEGEIKFGQRSSVLANDGRATNILGQRPSAFYKFTFPPPQGPVVSSPTHPDQERWYRDPNPVFVWPKGQFADAYSYALDRDPSGFPDTTSEGTAPTASYQNVQNGISYFHLRERAGGVWGGVSHYAVKIDNEPPADFKVNVSPGKRTTNRNPIFRFFTTDALSGLDHFEMKIISLSDAAVSEALFFEVSSPYQAPNFSPGRYQVIIRALDKAGNARDEAVAMNIVSSWMQFFDPEGIDLVFIFLPWPNIVAAIILLFLVFIIILFFLWRRHSHHLNHAFREDFTKIKDLWKKKPPVSHGASLAESRQASQGGPASPSQGGPPSNLPLAILFFALILLPAISYAQVQQVSAPVISVAPSQYYPLDETLYIEGKAKPNEKVELLFERVAGGAPPVRVSVEANSNGEWFYSGSAELASGEWNVRARTLGANPASPGGSQGGPSDWSNPRVIRSVVSGFILGGVRIKYLPIVSTLFFLFASAAILIVYSSLKVRSAQRTEREREMKEKTQALEKELRAKEMKAVETLVEQNFADIRRKMVGELEHLEAKAKTGGALSQEEEAHRLQILKELHEAEENIEKKLKDIA